MLFGPWSYERLRKAIFVSRLMVRFVAFCASLLDGLSPLICQYVLRFIPESIHLDFVLVLQYINNLLVVGCGKHRVRTAAAALSKALRRGGAITSIKSVLEPVTEIPWLAKHMVFFGPNARVFPKGQGWTSLFRLWSRTTILPLVKKHVQRILGRDVWAL